VQEWKRRYHSSNRPFLFFAKAFSYLTVYDGRGTTPTSERFEGAHAFILEFCNDQPKSFEQIRRGLQGSFLPGHDDGTIVPLIDVLTTLHRKRLLHKEGERYFTLALPVNPHRWHIRLATGIKFPDSFYPFTLFFLSFIHLVFGAVCARFPRIDQEQRGENCLTIFPFEGSLLSRARICRKLS
jgi:hypothetical protein